jgi:hypothetical protein
LKVYHDVKDQNLKLNGTHSASDFMVQECGFGMMSDEMISILRSIGSFPH